jgi:hypothetical protein
MGRGSNSEHKAFGMHTYRLTRLFKPKPVLVLNKEEKLLLDFAERGFIYACPECADILVLDNKRLLAATNLNNHDLSELNSRLWRLDIDTRSWNQPNSDNFICYCCGLEQSLDKT